MTIQYKEYTLEPEGNAFNLYKNVPTESKKGVKGFRDDVMGFAMRFETCIEAIIKDKMASRDEILTLRQYIDEYKELKDEVLLNTK